MKFNFENLNIWQKAMEIGEEVHLLSKNCSKKESLGLFNQIQTAADDIALNISVGSTGQPRSEFKRMVGEAIRSLSEMVTGLYKAKNRAYITTDEFEKFHKESFDLMKMMLAFRSKLKGKAIETAVQEAEVKQAAAG